MSRARTGMPLVAAIGIALGKGAAAQDTARVVNLELASRTFGNTRTVRVYLPPGYHEGADAARRHPVPHMKP